MQLFTLLSLILACIVAAAAIPLRLTDLHDQSTHFGAELEQALLDANVQIQLMLTTINDAMKNPPDAAAMGRIKLAFGPNAPMKEIEKNIHALVNGVMRVAEVDDDTIFGRTSYTIPGDLTSPVQTVFGKTKFKAVSPAFKTYAVLHEAAHYLWRAGDDCVEINGKMHILKMGQSRGSKSLGEFRLTTEEQVKDHYKKGVGYALSIDSRKPFNPANLNELFLRLRDTALNMDLNADSYALLGMLCFQRWSPGGTNQPSGSGEPSGSSGPGTLARPLTPSGSGEQKDPVSPTTSVKTVTPHPVTGSGGATTPATPVAPVTPHPATGSGGATTPATPVAPVAPVTPHPATGSGGATTPATPVAPDPPSGSKWKFPTLDPNRAGRKLKKPAAPSNPASGSGEPATPATPVTPRKLVKKPRESQASGSGT